LVSLFEIHGSLEAPACRRAARLISDVELQKLEGLRAWREHREIVEALRVRDPDSAAAAMERHVANAMSALTSDVEV
jgi:DNA-binding GntR family transcriptional regulator